MKRVLRDQRGMIPIIEVILVIAVLGVLGFVGYRAYQARQAKSTTQDSVLPEEFSYVDAEAPTDWKEYKNDQYGFSFKYPAKLILSEQTLKDGESDDKAVLSVTLKFKDAVGGYDLRILKDTLDAAVEAFDVGFQGNSYYSTLTRTDISKGGHKGVKFTYIPDEAVSYFFFEGIGVVYQFESVEETPSQNYPAGSLESKRIFNSIKFSK